MSSDTDDRVADLLSAVRESFESGAVAEDADELEAGGDLDEHVAEARSIVESNDPETVLEAVGLAELPDGDEPSSIPEAIARAPEARVRDLRALVTLANLAERDAGEDFADGLTALREALGAESERRDADASDEDGSADEAAPDEDGSDGGVFADDDEGEGDPEDSQSDLSDTLKTAAGTTVEEFSDDVEALKGRLEALAGDEDAEAGEAEDDGALGDDEEAKDEEDDTFQIGGDSSRSSRHSTMPSSDRADMRAVRRHSTMPDRN